MVVGLRKEQLTQTSECLGPTTLLFFLSWCLKSVLSNSIPFLLVRKGVGLHVRWVQVMDLWWLFGLDLDGNHHVYHHQIHHSIWQQGGTLVETRTQRKFWSEKVCFEFSLKKRDFYNWCLKISFLLFQLGHRESTRLLLCLVSNRCLMKHLVIKLGWQSGGGP